MKTWELFAISQINEELLRSKREPPINDCFACTNSRLMSLSAKCFDEGTRFGKIFRANGNWWMHIRAFIRKFLIGCKIAGEITGAPCFLSPERKRTAQTVYAEFPQNGIPKLVWWDEYRAVNSSTRRSARVILLKSYYAVNNAWLVFIVIRHYVANDLNHWWIFALGKKYFSSPKWISVKWKNKQESLAGIKFLALLPKKRCRTPLRFCNFCGDMWKVYRIFRVFRAEG